MSLRFRRTIKIVPGIKLNFGKRGVSTSIGGRGASVNISKLGVRKTVGIPRTGLSYSTTSSNKTTGSKRGSESKHGCLYYFFIWPFVLVIQASALLLKGASSVLKWLWGVATATPERKRITLIVGGGLLALGCISFTLVGMLDTAGIIDLSTPEPTLDMVAVNQTAMVAAWLPFTQTAAAMPTATVPSSTPTNTETPQATITPIPTYTPRPTSTATLIPYVSPAQPQYPSDITAVCKDGTYSYSKHRSGTCSHHGGVKIWVNRPAN